MWCGAQRVRAQRSAARSVQCTRAALAHRVAAIIARAASTHATIVCPTPLGNYAPAAIASTPGRTAAGLLAATGVERRGLARPRRGRRTPPRAGLQPARGLAAMARCWSIILAVSSA